MKPGPSGSAWSPIYDHRSDSDVVKDMLKHINGDSKLGLHGVATWTRHELGLRIRAKYGYDWLMLYKRERRGSVKQLARLRDKP